MSKVSRATGNKRLLQLAAPLVRLKPVQFDYSLFGEIRTCGTAACALGWAPSLQFAKDAGFSMAPASYDPKELLFRKDGNFVNWMDVALELFGLSSKAASFLFIPGSPHIGGLKPPTRTATAKRVANHIRRFVAMRSA